MTLPLLSIVPPVIASAGVVLHGAAVGALIASGVLLRAHRRNRTVLPWLVTAAWSLLGASLAAVGQMVRLLS